MCPPEPLPHPFDTTIQLLHQQLLAYTTTTTTPFNTTNQLHHHLIPTDNDIMYSSGSSSSSYHRRHSDAASIPDGLPHRDSARSRQSSTSSERSCEAMSAYQTAHLWRCMLELQERYGCYNSTRVSLAVGAGDDALDLMPSRFIIDTLNDSLVDLPEEGWEMLDSVYMRQDHHQAPKGKSKHGRFWRRR
jgi:hypothetical protein